MSKENHNNGAKENQSIRVEVEIEKLKPHPKSAKIYGEDEDFSDLELKIEARGKIVETLKVNSKTYEVVSGNRRLRAAKNLGYNTVPVEFISYDNEADELADIINFNADRERTKEQKVREGMALEEAYKVESYQIRILNLQQYSSDVDTQSTSETTDSKEPKIGKEEAEITTRDRVAKDVKIGSGKTYERAKNVVIKADEFKNNGRDIDSKVLIHVLEKSVATAEKLIGVIDTLAEEQKGQILSNMKTAVDFLPRSSTSPTVKEKKVVYVTARKNCRALGSTIKYLMNTSPQFKTNEQKDEYKGLIEGHIENLQQLLLSVEKAELSISMPTGKKGKSSNSKK